VPTLGFYILSLLSSILTRNNFESVKLIDKIKIATVDGYQRREGKFVFLVGGKQNFRSFVYEHRRATVDLSRAEYFFVFVFVNDITHISMHKISLILWFVSSIGLLRCGL
jgi:hypothetical protein